MFDSWSWDSAGALPTLDVMWRRAAELADNARALLGEMLCAWHFHCEHVAEGTSVHPVLGAVAVCHHCASTDGLDVTPFPALAAA